MAKTFWSVGFIVIEAIKSLESWQQKRYSWISLVKVIVSFLRIVSWRIVCWLISLFWGMFLSSLIHTITLSVRSDIHLTLGLYHFFFQAIEDGTQQSEAQSSCCPYWNHKPSSYGRPCPIKCAGKQTKLRRRELSVSQCFSVKSRFIKLVVELY